MAEMKGGLMNGGFCNSPHPTAAEVFCRRFKDHEGKCGAYSFSIGAPDEWWKVVEL